MFPYQPQDAVSIALYTGLSSISRVLDSCRHCYIPFLSHSCDSAKKSRANSMFFPTCSTFPRQCPLFPDNVHYFPTTFTIPRQRPQKGSIFTSTFKTHLRSQPSKTFHFPSRDPSPTPTPCRRQEPPPNPPALLPAPGSCRPARPAIIKMIHYFPTKGSLFSHNIHYFPTWYVIPL
jgi:hypothetical protein